MADQFKNFIIGVFVVIACALIVFIILFLHPTTGDEGRVLYVRFTDVDKINVGTRVTLAGKPIGEVSEVTEVPDAREGPKDEFGHYYIYQLKLLIDSHVKIYNTDLVTARTSGLLGEKSVAIIPQVPPEGQVPHLVTKGEILYAEHPASVEETMAEFKQVADSVSAVLQEVRDEKVIHKLAVTIENIQDITAAIDMPEDLRTIVTNLRSISENFNLGSADFKSIFARMNKGEGTIGHLLAKDETYLRLNALLSKGDTVLNDMEHYGILYHQDQGWQRLRARRMNLLQKLSTPQEFRNYFNDEMDQITTSLARVSMVLEKSEGCCPPCVLWQDAEFSKVYAELIRRVEDLDEAIKMYNQQMEDLRAEQTELKPKLCGAPCRRGK